MHVTPIKQDIKDERNKAYADPTGETLRPYLEKVQAEVTDGRLAGMIQDCLTTKATDEDYQRLEERFQKNE